MGSGDISETEELSAGPVTAQPGMFYSGGGSLTSAPGERRPSAQRP